MDWLDAIASSKLLRMRNSALRCALRSALQLDLALLMLLSKRCVCDSSHVTTGHLAICKRTYRSYYRHNLLRNLIHDSGAMALNVNVLSIVVEPPIVTSNQSHRIDLKIVINDGMYHH